MPKEREKIPAKEILEKVSATNLVEAQLLNLPLPENYDPSLQQSGPKLHRLAQICKLGLCNFK
jgi:hypothetical protein